ncbi:DUF6907 domain-containing protein [Streptomyces polygonati]|uniref:DUF6907 domain-containing protein n=1 Tax=Streptomyces polygonati TaxID=1617087 RepID=A0ABV8HJU3_9ACTN
MRSSGDGRGEGGADRATCAGGGSRRSRSGARRPRCRVRAAGRTWTITTSNGYTATGYLPGWAEENPSQTGVRPDTLPVVLADISHRAPFDGQLIRVAPGGYGPGEEKAILAGSIDCNPDTGSAEPPEPVVNVHLIEDYWINGLAPADLARFAAALRAQADRLDHEIRPRLIAYREDWTAHHPT